MASSTSAWLLLAILLCALVAPTQQQIQGGECNIVCKHDSVRSTTQVCACDCIVGGTWKGIDCGECALGGCLHGVLDKEVCACECENFWGADECDQCDADCTYGDPTAECTCSCNYGYTGPRCEDCNLECHNNATLATNGKCECIDCKAPWGGQSCDECGLECQNAGKRVPGNLACKCLCEGAWEGEDCSDCSTKCRNGGTLNEKCECICEGDWTGEECNECELECTKDQGTVNRDLCKCDCKDQWHGKLCDTCDELACANGGKEDEEKCSCTCTGQWGGPACLACNPDCVNGVVDLRSCVCDCDQGWEGEACDKCNTDLFKCENGGFVNEESCSCECGCEWSGERCTDFNSRPPAELGVGYQISNDTFHIYKPVEVLGELNVDRVQFSGVLSSSIKELEVGGGISLPEGGLQIEGSVRTDSVHLEGSAFVQGVSHVSQVSSPNGTLYVSNDMKVLGRVMTPTIAPKDGTVHFLNDVQIENTLITSKLEVANELVVEGTLGVMGKLDTSRIEPIHADKPITISGGLHVDTLLVNSIVSHGYDPVQIQGALFTSGNIGVTEITSQDGTWLDVNGLVIHPFHPAKSAHSLFPKNQMTLSPRPAACEGYTAHSTHLLDFVSFKETIFKQTVPFVPECDSHCVLFNDIDASEFCPGIVELSFVSNTGVEFGFNLESSKAPDGSYGFRVTHADGQMAQLRQDTLEIAGLGDFAIYNFRLDKFGCRLSLCTRYAKVVTAIASIRQPLFESMVSSSQSDLIANAGGGGGGGDGKCDKECDPEGVINPNA